MVPTLPLGGHRRAMRPDADLSPAGVARLLGEFVEELGLRDATLVGNDTGGALAQLLVAERPDLVGELVLASCEAFENFPPGLPGRVSALTARMPGGLAMAGWSMRFRPFSRLPVTWGWMAKRPIPAAKLNSWFAPLRSDPGARRDLAAFVSGMDRRLLSDAAERLRGQLHAHPARPAGRARAPRAAVRRSDRLGEGEQSRRVVGVLDPDQPLVVLAVVRLGRILECRVGEVRVHPA